MLTRSLRRIHRSSSPTSQMLPGRHRPVGNRQLSPPWTTGSWPLDGLIAASLNVRAGPPLAPVAPRPSGRWDCPGAAQCAFGWCSRPGAAARACDVVPLRTTAMERARGLCPSESRLETRTDSMSPSRAAGSGAVLFRAPCARIVLVVRLPFGSGSYAAGSARLGCQSRRPDHPSQIRDAPLAPSSWLSSGECRGRGIESSLASSLA